MAQLKIKLFNQETNKFETITQPFVSGLVMYKAMEVMTEVEKNEKEGKVYTPVEEMDIYLDLIVTAFNNEKVTHESILGGIAADELASTLGALFDDIVLNEEQKKMKKLQQQAELEKVTN